MNFATKLKNSSSDHDTVRNPFYGSCNSGSCWGVMITDKQYDKNANKTGREIELKNTRRSFDFCAKWVEYCEAYWSIYSCTQTYNTL